MSDKLARAKHTSEAIQRRIVELSETADSFRQPVSSSPYAGKHARPMTKPDQAQATESTASRTKRAQAGPSAPEAHSTPTHMAARKDLDAYDTNPSASDLDDSSLRSRRFDTHNADLPYRDSPTGLPLESEILDASDDMLGHSPVEPMVEVKAIKVDSVKAGESGEAQSVSSSAALISVCVMISRITGFVRTWAMAFALGSTLLASSYTVANNLPNMLYELVVGGMLVTAFLPVYISVKKKLGTEASNAYASNLLSLVVIFLGIVAVACVAFPAGVIYTQSFMSDQSEMTTSVFFFQFFALQIIFYGVSGVVSGLLNANRDYLWSSIAPVANNVIVIATFLAYAFVAPHDSQLALYIIAIGNPLGVFIQMAIQIPALKRNGIHIRPRVDFRDPALRETLAIGIPAVIVMLSSFAVVSVQNAAALAFVSSGPSVLAYARLWFTLPYAFLAVPITTTMFTELANMQAEGNTEGVKRGIISGTNQILFFMIPFALYLIVFATPLITMYHAGAFTAENITAIASYLAVFALALPFYGVNTYLQKIFSSLRKMTIFAIFNIGAALIQIGLTIVAALAVSQGIADIPLESIALAELVFYLVSDICLFFYLRKRFGAFGLRSTAKAFISALVLGALGAAAGGGALFAIETFIAPLSGSIPQAFSYIVIGGMISLVVTFGLALKLKIPEAAFVSSIFARLTSKLKRTEKRKTP